MKIVRQSKPYLCESIRSRFRPGVIVCDPHRLDEFLNGDSRGRDLNEVFFSDEEANVYSEGIAVALFDHPSETCKVTVRSSRSKSVLRRQPSFASEGWLLGTEKGELVACNVDALLFWDPFEIDEDPQRYFRFSVPRGWYEVAMRLEARSDEDDTWEDNAEFVLTRVKSRPKFNVTTTATVQNSESTSAEASASSVSESSAQASTSLADVELIKAVLSRFTSATFKQFIRELFTREECEPLPEANYLGDGVFCESFINAYLGNLCRVLVLQHLPLSLFTNPRIEALSSDPTLTERLMRIKEMFQGRAGYFGMVSPELVKATQLRSLAFLLNLSGVQKERYFDEIIPQYSQLARSLGLHAPVTMVGSYDSFTDLNGDRVKSVLKRLLSSGSDGIAIQITPSGPGVLSFGSQTSFESGVLLSNICPYEPVVASLAQQNEQLIREFEELLRADGSEEQIEQFLVAHAKEIFGEKYDRVESQIWLRFPELDIAGKERRTDLFMRNAVSSDWDLFEIKNPISLVRGYRDGPVFVAEVAHAITQLKRYSHLFATPAVREQLKRSGIEYFEPTLNLVIGRKPQIPLQQWRWLLANHDKDVHLITYDDLLGEMKVRLNEHAQLLDKLKRPLP